MRCYLRPKVRICTGIWCRLVTKKEPESTGLVSGMQHLDNWLLTSSNIEKLHILTFYLVYHFRSQVGIVIVSFNIFFCHCFNFSIFLFMLCLQVFLQDIYWVISSSQGNVRHIIGRWSTRVLDTRFSSYLCSNLYSFWSPFLRITRLMLHYKYAEELNKGFVWLCSRKWEREESFHFDGPSSI